MFDKFCDYMYYLLTSPFKKVRKSVNQWYILFKVLGKRFDEAMESIEDAREQTMLATCEPVMLAVHADERHMSRYPGECDENFRTRIANYAEVLKLGGTDQGVLLAVRTLGFKNPEIIRANELTGYDINSQLPDRWAEFYIVVKMNVNESLPVSVDILKKEVRKTKVVGAKDNYSLQYSLSITEQNTVMISHVHFSALIQNFKLVSEKVRDSYKISITHKEDIKVIWHNQYNLFFLDGSWKLDGSRILNAYENQEEL
ncbi:MAG: hypothetical protein K2M60_05800 [Lachnospiraceae bacterium]|nr:hypothetical protein [Lachnospiraceae bacterium]MDE6251169.1 hypothetical protein [Lachnospiraceae bacterium]